MAKKGKNQLAVLEFSRGVGKSICMAYSDGWMGGGWQLISGKLSSR